MRLIQIKPKAQVAKTESDQNGIGARCDYAARAVNAAWKI